MFFAIMCHDKADSLHVRMENRDAHLAYLGGFAHLAHAVGPMFNDDDGMAGSLLIMNFDDKAAADDFAANDPYNKAGLFESVTIRAWKQVLPKLD